MKLTLRTILLFSIALLLGNGAAFAQKTKGKEQNNAYHKTPMVEAITDNPNALLWEISKEGLKYPSYLYGTIHLIGADDFIMSDLTVDRFNRTDQLTLEIDMDNAFSLLSALNGSFMKDGISLQDLLTEEEYGQLADYFTENLGLPIKLFERMKPILLSSLITEKGITSEVTSYETEFMGMAKKENKNIEGLETAAFQLSLFDSIPYDQQARMLMDGLNGEGDNSMETFETMVELYKAQDLTKMHEFITEESSDIGEFDELLLNKRNRAWIPIMDKMINEKPTFFAVGAGHLAGESGVIELLKKAGYELTPLRPVDLD